MTAVPTEPRPGKDPGNPLPVAAVATLIEGWINRLGEIWIEGQIVQLNQRGAMRTAFATLRDPEKNSSLALTIPVGLIEALPHPLESGSRVIVQAKANFWTSRGSLQLAVRSIRQVGVGSLLAQIEQLKQKLAAEGLFASERKLPLPFIPRLVGLITGRNSEAEKDVVTNATRRWPGVRFIIHAVSVQGVRATQEVIAALTSLDAEPEVDVIVIARGGGGVEDLLPFSDEALIRAVAAAKTPVVSAIGHEADAPLLDLVADLRASTPTDAGRRIVPDLAAEAAGLASARERLTSALTRFLDHEQDRLDHLRWRPVLTTPARLVNNHQSELDALRLTGRRCLGQVIDQATGNVATLVASLRALSPQATLNRGYAVATTGQGQVLRQPDQAPSGTKIVLRLAGGQLATTAD